MSESERLPNGLTPEQDEAFQNLAEAIATMPRCEKDPETGRMQHLEPYSERLGHGVIKTGCRTCDFWITD